MRSLIAERCRAEASNIELLVGVERVSCAGRKEGAMFGGESVAYISLCGSAREAWEVKDNRR
jgi:hypothetical protein